MNDRRVVRGNTFAALVIPVNMQPDPMLIEKQKQDEHARKKRLELLKVGNLSSHSPVTKRRGRNEKIKSGRRRRVTTNPRS